MQAMIINVSVLHFNRIGLNREDWWVIISFLAVTKPDLNISLKYHYIIRAVTKISLLKTKNIISLQFNIVHHFFILKDLYFIFIILIHEIT